MEEGCRNSRVGQGESPLSLKCLMLHSIIQTSHKVDSEKFEYQNATGASTLHNDDDGTTYEADINGEDKHHDEEMHPWP